MVNQKKVTLKQLGSTGLSRQGGYIYDEFLPELRWPRAGKIYKEMSSNDPTIGAILYLAEMLIRGVSWNVEPCSTSKEDVEAAEFLKSCMDDMEMSWANTISEILSMLSYGFSLHEIVYKVRRGPRENNPKYKSRYSDCKIGWRKLPIRSQTSIEKWIFNDDGDVTAFEQVAEPDYKHVIIPMSKALLFRTRVSLENPEGKSLLRNAYRPWFYKKHFEEIEGIGIERDLAGFPILTAPEGMDLWNADDPIMIELRKQAEMLVSSIRRDSEEGLVLPHGWELKLLSSGSSRQINVGEIIDRYDNRIAITMLSDIVLIGAGRTGSFALADTKQSMLAASLQSQLSNIADVFNNKAVPELFRVNGYTDLENLPKIVPGMLQTPTLKELALMLRAMGLNIAGDMKLQNYLRRLLGAPDLSEEEFAALYAAQANEDKDKGKGDGPDLLDKDFEQNDVKYTGQ